MKFDDIFSGSQTPIADVEAEVETLKTGQAQFQQTLNVALMGTATISYIGGTTTTDAVNIQHNLGYTPSFLCFFVNGSTYQPLPYWDFGVAGTSLNSVVSVIADNVQLQFSWSHRIAQTANTITIKYYIFREPVSV